MREMLLARSDKLVPLNHFMRRIIVSNFQVQLQFLLEPTAFTDVAELCILYGQTVLDIVYYIGCLKMSKISYFEQNLAEILQKQKKEEFYTKKYNYDNFEIKFQQQIFQKMIDIGCFL